MSDYIMDALPASFRLGEIRIDEKGKDDTVVYLHSVGIENTRATRGWLTEDTLKGLKGLGEITDVTVTFDYRIVVEMIPGVNTKAKARRVITAYMRAANRTANALCGAVQYNITHAEPINPMAVSSGDLDWDPYNK